MQADGSNRITDKIQLFVRVRRAIVKVKFVGDAIGLYGTLQYPLEVHGIVVEKNLTADNHS